MSAAAESEALNLDAYLRRVGYEGARDASLPTLRALHALHPAAIPFENLDSRFGVVPSLDLAAIQAKLVGQRRGGYCFEQNALFGAALRALGFEVHDLIARVRWQTPVDAPDTARSHRLLGVKVDGEDWIADVGFGSCTLTAPLPLGARGPQQTPHEAVRLVPLVGGERELQADLDGQWASLYRFGPDPVPAIDFEVANWFAATHPQSRFVLNLTLSRVTPGVRLSLLNTQFTRRVHGRPVERRILADGGELAAVLRDDFGIDPPPHAVLDAVAAGQFV